ncbi:uncharacterized protein LOC141606659 [Silene latifolia]|uniref:uncharacterized protein LOC141606659 n=1 Tax=Silene latifolia TaxID=37657 RepID=UPI003D76AFB4
MDDIFDKLVSELPSMENMAFYGCTMPMNMRIASQTLKELGIHDCYDLINVVVDVPELDIFCYNGDLQLSSVINSQSKYNAYLHLNIAKLDNRALVRIKNLLRKSKCCKVLSIILNDAHDVPEIEVDMDRLSKIRQYRDEPCHVQELKLSVSCSTPTSVLGESTCKALIDGLLWCCRPDILCLSVTIPYDNNIIRTLLEILENQVKYWKHPLKRMEIEGTNCSDLFSNYDLDLRLRLYW